VLAICCLLTGLCLIAGCEMFAPQKPQFTLVNDSDTVLRERISLGEAIGALKSDDFGRMNRAGNYSVYYIHGEDIDSTGNAKNWIMAVKTNQSQFYFEYQDQNYKEYPWNEKIISKPILIDEIILPENLFSLNRDLIGKIFGDTAVTRKEIQMENGAYTLTITKNSPFEYQFNAYSGEIILK
jgi:hypothetical protein